MITSTREVANIDTPPKSSSTSTCKVRPCRSKKSMTSLLSLITPTNLAIEKVKFLASSTYNPTFHYVWEEDIAEPTFKNEAKYSLWRAIKSQDHQNIVSSAATFFSVSISDHDLQAAKAAAAVKGKIS